MTFISLFEAVAIVTVIIAVLIALPLALFW